MPCLKLGRCSKGAEWGSGECLGNCMEETEQSCVFFAVFRFGVRYLISQALLVGCVQT